jgi:MFS superfamily sulfate permease-like transporter
MVRAIRPHGPSEVTSAGAGASLEDAAAPIGTPHWPDLLAGLSIAGLLLPEAVAYSGLASLPPQAGVIALFAGLVCYGVLGRSRYAIVTATSSSAAVLAAATLSVAGADPIRRAALASILIVGTGIAFVLAGWFRLGAMSNLIARPVLRGYVFGLALVIVVKQVPQLVGMRVHSADFAPVLLEVVRGTRSWVPASVAIGLASLAVLFGLERVRKIPGALVVIVAGIAGASFLSSRGVVLTGPIRLSPSLPAFVVPPARQTLQLVEFSLALMFILYAESYSSIRTYALKHDEAVRPNRDLLALGLSNMVSGLLQGTPVGAGYSGTSANEAAGAQSRWAGLSAAAVILVLVVLFLPWIERIPEPVLAAIVIHAVSKSLRPMVFRPYFKWQRDRLVALTSILAVLAFGVLGGLLAAIAFSLVMLLQSLAAPRLSELGRLGVHDFVSCARYPRAERVPEMLIVRPEEPLFFANADPLLALVRHRVRERPDTRIVVLSLEESPDLDSTSLECLADFALWLAARHIEIRVARLKDKSRDALLRANLPQLSEAELEYSSVDDAVSARASTAPT